MKRIGTLGVALLAFLALPVQAQDFYLADNGVTIKCKGADIGTTGVVNGVEYISADRAMLDDLIADNEDVTRVCTSNISTMSELFSGKENFNQDIGNWDVSSVEDMSNMFFNAAAFNQDISGWDVSSVENMDYMFQRAAAFNQDLTHWCTVNIPEPPTQFAYNSGFNAQNHPVWGTCSAFFYLADMA